MDPMWTPILTIYGIGLAVTAVALLRAQSFKHELLVNVGSIVLWPLYWTFFVATLLLNRRRP